MKHASLCITILIVTACIAGCNQSGEVDNSTGAKNLAVMCASFTANPVVVDGKLEEAVWEKAAAYDMALADDRSVGGKTVEEGARYVWHGTMSFSMLVSTLKILIS